MEEDPDVRGGGRAAENMRITRHPDLADDRTSGAAEPSSARSQLPPIHLEVDGRNLVYVVLSMKGGFDG